MFDHCQPILINNLYGLLTINTTDHSLCVKSRQWYFFYDYGYSLLIRFINIAHLISNSYIFKIYSIINKEKILIYDSTNKTITNNDIQIDIKNSNSGVLFELITNKNQNIPQTSFIIDYVFRATSQSRFGREILQDNSTSSSSFSPSQPAFIALICIVAILVVAIIIAITILCYRHYSHRKHSKKRHKNRRKFRRNSIDQAHLAASITPSSTSSYSLRSSQRLFSNQHQQPIDTLQQTLSLGQSQSTLPSMIPSRRLQQSMIGAYLNDLNAFQPKVLDPKQLNPYLFVDLHSTSSETFQDINFKKSSNENTTTSGYDTSTGNEDRNYKTSLRNRRRRLNHHQRQRRRSTLTLKRSNGSRFLMRERSLPNTLTKLPQLRQRNHLFNIRDNNSTSTTSNSNNNNQDLIPTDFSITTDDYDDSHSYHVNQSCKMDTIEEEKPAIIIHKPHFFEMVSTQRGDDSDMPNYEDLPRPFKSSGNKGDGIAYVNDSIIV